METEVLNKLAKKVSELIGEPVEIEENNDAGYEYVIWIGEGKDALALTCEDIPEDADPYTAEDDCYNQLFLIENVLRWMKEHGKLK